jgi:hypothetical protein
MAMERIEQTRVQSRLIAQQKQSFRIVIESSDGIDGGRKTEFRERPVPGLLGSELGEHTVWFVKCDEHVSLRAMSIRTILFPAKREAARRRIPGDDRQNRHRIRMRQQRGNSFHVKPGRESSVREKTMIKGIDTMKFAAIFVLSCMMSLSGCMHVLQDCIEGSGKTSVQDRKISGFFGIDLRTTGTVEITAGPVFSVSIEAEDNLQQHLKLAVEEEVLIISSKECLQATKPIMVKVTMPEIRSLELSGSGAIRGMNKLTADKMFLEVSGSGDIDVEVGATVLRSSLTGSGGLVLRGVVKDHDTKISGSGDVRAVGLRTENATARISGSGDCDLSVSNQLRATISGSGNVYYHGKINKVESHVSGSGDVTARP